MKRRKSLLRSDCSDEESEGQSCDKSHVLRKRKCINYSVPGEKDDDDDDDDDEEGEEEVEEEEDENHNQIQRIWDKEMWPVTCGTKEGIMDAEKLAKSEKCIECEARHFTPPAFEEFAGKGSSKKWKSTIYSDGKPLQYWFDEGLLDTGGYFKKGTKNFKKKKRFQNNGDESTYNLRRHDSVGDSIVIEESEADFTEDSEDEDVSMRLSGHRSWILRTEEVKERVDDRNKGDYVNSDHSEENQDDKPDHEEMNDDKDMLDNPKYLSANKEPDPRLIISTSKKHALQKKLIVTLERISLLKSASQTITVEHPLEDKRRDSDSEFNYTKEKGIQTENFLEMSETMKTEEPVEAKMVDVARKSFPQQAVEEEMNESLRLSAAPLSIRGPVKCDNHTDVSSSDRIQSQTMSETRSDHGSESTHISDMVENSPSEILAGYDVDTMDLDQLQRETLKMQLEASRLQKEYYSLKLYRLKVLMEQKTVNSTLIGPNIDAVFKS